MLKRKSRYVTALKRAPLYMRLKFWVETPENLSNLLDSINFYLLIVLGAITVAGLLCGWFAP